MNKLINELRIGNLVTCQHGIVSMLGIEKMDCYVHVVSQDLDTIVFAPKLLPIPLTEEILLKCGFEDWGKTVINDKESEILYCLHNFIDGTSDFKVAKVTDTYGGTKQSYYRIYIDHDVLYTQYNVESLHQLQNIFWVMTGQELTIQL